MERIKRRFAVLISTGLFSVVLVSSPVTFVSVDGSQATPTPTETTNGAGGGGHTGGYRIFDGSQATPTPTETTNGAGGGGHTGG
jgi:hypothetical protein